MEKIKIFDDFYQFSTYLDFIDLSFNQYLLLGKGTLLIHTGSKEQTEVMMPLLKSILGNNTLSYIFISHFESDECGGLSLLKEHFPQAKPICSQVTARQLKGFGITEDVIIKNPGDSFEMDSFKLKFIAYPSEMHLWEGLIAFEEQRGYLFSSDLFIHHGRIKSTIENANWQDEIGKVSLQQVPSPEAKEALQDVLNRLPVKYVMPGHGSCLKV